MDQERADRFVQCFLGLVIAECREAQMENDLRRSSFDWDGRLGFSGQALCLGESLLEARGWDPADFLRRVRQGVTNEGWRNSERLRRLLNGSDPTPLEEQGDSDADLAEPLIRGVAVGLRYFRDLGGLMEVSHQVCRLTHPEPIFRYSSLAINAIISRGVRGWKREEALSFAAEIAGHAPHEVLDCLTAPFEEGDEEKNGEPGVLRCLRQAIRYFLNGVVGFEDSEEGSGRLWVPGAAPLAGALLGAFGHWDLDPCPSLSPRVTDRVHRIGHSLLKAALRD
ncbi:MAG: ADP-ribosylglycohydrolase family protein [Armatimonadetes bacterium]|nr:ADP-ribosylglycohydrolase family protein [Armatimonadota bacterium]MDW8122579.1 ADP-ribosylglycohydrolase family protein [Armatimonadota bacterium]